MPQTLTRMQTTRARKPAAGRACAALATITLLSGHAAAQRAFTWQEIKDRFVASNPTLQAARIGIEESRAQEVTAYLRPNPALTVASDGTQLAPADGAWRPFARSEEHTSELQSHVNLVCRLLL